VTFDRHPPADFFSSSTVSRTQQKPSACVASTRGQERLVDSWLVSCPAFQHQHQHAVCIHFIIIIALKKPSPSPGNRLRTTTTTTTSIRHPPSSVCCPPPPPLLASQQSTACGTLALAIRATAMASSSSSWWTCVPWRSSGAMAVILLQPLYNCVGFIRWSGGVQLSCYISFTIYAQQLILHWLTD
jgi:hypothetical protein